jgi:hypothetical protein
MSTADRGFVACLTILALTTFVGPAHAATFYVDPVNGLDTASGSSASPFKTLQTVVDSLVQTQVTSNGTLVPANSAGPIKPGDTIALLTGYHGTLTIKGKHNTQHVTIAAAPGATARLARVVVRDSSRWTLRGLDVSPSHAPTYAKNTMIDLQAYNDQGQLKEIVVENCLLRSVPDASGWSAADWNNKAANGISAGGTKLTILNNTLKNVNFGISVGATSSLVKGNVIANFSGDGLRGLGNYTVFEGNTVKNCYDVNANHDDGFQSWSRGSDGKVGTGEVIGVVLRGNRFINYEDPNQPFRGTLQGIGLFDGTFVDWVIENNVVITDHWHGITLMGARDCQVVNNTVIDPNTATPGPPWIRIANHKDGTAPSGCLVRNNLATAFNSASTGVTEDHNIKITKLADHFVDAANGDLHLIAGSAAIDSGSSTKAPANDFDGVPRPQGQGVEVGAYEWYTGTAPTPDSGGNPTTDSGSPQAADGGISSTADGGSPPTGDDGWTPLADGAPLPTGDSGCVHCAREDTLAGGCAVAFVGATPCPLAVLALLVLVPLLGRGLQGGRRVDRRLRPCNTARWLGRSR